MSLPGVAEKLAYMHYDEKCAPIFSFGQNFKMYNEGINWNNLWNSYFLII